VTLFQGTAGFYRQHRSGVPANVAAIVAEAAPQRRPRSLLDIGTGTGFVVEALQTSFDDVIGIDIDTDLLQVARGVVQPLHGQRLRFIEANAEQFQPPNGWAADLVTICRTFHWLDRPAVLTHLDQFVASDGAVAILGDNSIWAANAPCLDSCPEREGVRQRTACRCAHRWPPGASTPELSPRTLTSRPREGVASPRCRRPAPLRDDTGAVLVDFIPGETLSALARRRGVGDREWRMVGAAYRRIHAMQFPAPLRGRFGPERLELTPEDPVDLLHSKVDAAEPAVRSQQPALLPALNKLRKRIDARADELRREAPCLTHTDANFHNIIVGTDRATLIDWDYPAVHYPLEELEALEEHAYLNGISELPAAFFAGYGKGDLPPAPAAPSHRRLLEQPQLQRVVRDGGRQPIPPRQTIDAAHLGSSTPPPDPQDRRPTSSRPSR